MWVKRNIKKNHLLGFFLKLLNGPLVNATALVDEMAGGGGLARVHVADDHNVDVNLLLAHGDMRVKFLSAKVSYWMKPRN